MRLWVITRNFSFFFKLCTVANLPYRLLTHTDTLLNHSKPPLHDGTTVLLPFVTSPFFMIKLKQKEEIVEKVPK